jgi:hypothetical protein
LLWLVLRAGKEGVVVYADSEIPLNVGIASIAAFSSIDASMRAISTVRIGADADAT